MSEQVITQSAAPAATTEVKVEAPVSTPVAEVAESAEALEAEGQELAAEAAAAETPAEKAKVEQKIKEWVLKGSDGKDIKISDEKELIRRAQLGVGAEKRFQEAAEIKKEAAKLLDMLQKDPLGLLDELGIDSLTVAQQRMLKQLEKEAKTPEELQRDQELAELEQLRNEAKSLKEEKERVEFEKIMSEESRKIEDEMIGALQEQKLPLKPMYIKKMAEIMQAGMEKGIDLSAKEALAIARKDVVTDLRELLDASPDELLEELVGTGNVKRLRKRYIAKAKASVPTAASIQNSGQSEVDEKPRQKISTKDWMKIR